MEHVLQVDDLDYPYLKNPPGEIAGVSPVSRVCWGTSFPSGPSAA